MMMGTRVLVVGALSVMMGCGPGPKWVNTVNVASRIKMSSRYVTGSKSIKVQAKEIGLKLDISLPASIPRVSPSKLEFAAKHFTFDPFIVSPFEDWLTRLAQTKSEQAKAQCEDRGLDVAAAEQDVDGQTRVLNVRFAQDKSGTLSVTLTGTKSKDLIVMLRSSPTTSVFNCVVEWFDADTLKDKIPGQILNFRSEYLKELEKANGFESAKVGNRLKRANSLEPEPQTTDQDQDVKEQESEAPKTDEEVIEMSGTSPEKSEAEDGKTQAKAEESSTQEVNPGNVNSGKTSEAQMRN